MPVTIHDGEEASLTLDIKLSVLVHGLSQEFDSSTRRLILL
jgi:hypothetical protein